MIVNVIIINIIITNIIIILKVGIPGKSSVAGSMMLVSIGGRWQCAVCSVQCVV